MRMTLPYLLRGGVLAAACVCLNACAQEVGSSISLLKTECVGRYQLSLPGELDIAIHSLKLSESEGYSRSDTSFSDASIGSDSGFSSGGVIYVGPITSLGYFSKFKAKYARPDGKNSGVAFFKNGFKSDWPNGSDAFLYKDGRIYGFESNGPRNKLLYKSRREYFLANFSPRAIFDKPVRETNTLFGG